MRDEAEPVEPIRMAGELPDGLKEPVPACLHEPARPKDAVWLPPLSRTANTNPVLPHQWCRRCGAIRNEGGDRGKRLGFFLNVLGRPEEWLGRERKRGAVVPKITDVQKRLIVEDLIGDQRFVENLVGAPRALQVMLRWPWIVER